MKTAEDETSVASVIVQYLAAAGIRHIFGYPGTPNIELIEAARRAGLELVLARREGTAGFMAQAYGMLTKHPGVCMSTLGPGSTSLVNAVANAHLDRVPMLAISGQTSTAREAYFTHQVVDHGLLFAPITKWAAAMRPESAATVMRKALRVATADRPGPVHLSTNGNLIKAPATDQEVVLPPMRPVTRWARVLRRDADDADAITMLERSTRPVLLTGISALWSGVTEALVAFAERIGCPVVVSPMSKGVFPEDHPYYASALDMACSDLVWDFIAESDLILAVGFDAVELIKPWRLRIPTIHIDSTANTDQIYQAEVELIGDIASILDDLAAAFAGEPRRGPGAVARHREKLLEVYYSGRVQGKLNPTDVIDALNVAFPANTILTTDVGSHKLLVGQGWLARMPGSLLMTNGLSSMGFALPSAITAKLIHPNRPVVCTVGDGGFAMVQGELRLASELGLGLVVVVFSDDSLNRIEIKQQLRDYPSMMTRIGRSDLVKLAEAMECDGERVETVAELQALLARAAGVLDRPLVVEARIDPSQYLAQF